VIVYKCWNPSCERYAGLGYAQRLKAPTSCPHCTKPLWKENIIHPWLSTFMGGVSGLLLGSLLGPQGAVIGSMIGLFIPLFLGSHLS
jgi:hypothetical protein